MMMNMTYKTAMTIALSTLAAGIILYGVGLLIEHQRETPITLEILNERLNWLLVTMLVSYIVIITWLHRILIRLINLKHDLANHRLSIERELFYLERNKKIPRNAK